MSIKYCSHCGEREVGLASDFCPACHNEYVEMHFKLFVAAAQGFCANPENFSPQRRAKESLRQATACMKAYWSIEE